MRSYRAAAPSGQQFEVRHGSQLAVLVEVGGGIRSYTVGGEPVVDGYAATEMCSGGRGQILFPWPNRIRDGRYDFQGTGYRLALSEPERGHAIHGLSRWLPWRTTEHREDSLKLSCWLHPQPGYPFSLELGLAYSLTARGLTVVMSATNRGSGRCPFGAGAHPYLTAEPDLVDAAVLELPASMRLNTDEGGIPIGPVPVAGTAFDFRAPRKIGNARIDDTFTDLGRGSDGTARVRLGGRSRSSTLWMDRSFEYVQVFSGDTLAQADRRRGGLAIEPMTCAPNAFVSGAGLLVLNPGESFTGTWGIESHST